MASVKRFENLEAWKISRATTKNIYSITSKESFSRDFGLRDQIRRSSVSVMSNIAEGFERDGNKEFLNFLSIAKGSSGEVRAQLYVASDQNYISKEEFDSIYNKTLENGRILNGSIAYLKQSDFKGKKFK